LGNPLINEVIIGLPDKKFFSISKPDNDVQFLDYVGWPTLPAIIDILFRGAVNSVLNTSFADIAPTNIPRGDLITTFLTGLPGLNQAPNAVASEMLRLNVDTPVTPYGKQNRFGVIGGDNAGFPNGRRLGDDVIDIALRVVMGALCYLPGSPFCTPDQAVVGNVEFLDGAPVQDTDFGNTFPFLNPPLPGAVTNNNAGVCSPAQPMKVPFQK